jgi:nicotinamidase-related amidase
MPAKNEHLHGFVPDRSPVALILIDVINDLEFDEGEALLRHALPMAKRLAALKRRARQADIPVIYVNDNFGRWQSDITKIVAHCLDEPVRGQPLVKLLRPGDDDYVVVKPKHSGFYSTTLDVLLMYLGVKTLILTGIAANSCVLFTANDAYMRDFHLFVPKDCVASNQARDTTHAIRQMESLLKADTRSSPTLDLRSLRQKGAHTSG